MDKLQKWAHLAEITGAIAVVISLLYVGYQVSENTSAQYSQTEMNLFSLGYDLDAWYQDQDFVAVVVKADNDYQSLSVPEKLQFDKYVLMSLNLWAYALSNFSRGQLDANEWEAWDNYFTGEIRRDGWLAVYGEYRAGYNREFQQHIQSIIDGR